MARIPAVSAIVERFETAELGTAAAEIIMRARRLASQTIASLQETQSPSSPRGRQLKPDDVPTSPQRRMGASPITVGGEETDASNRRRSRDSRRSMDFVRKSLEAPHRIKAHLRSSDSGTVRSPQVKVPSPSTSSNTKPRILPHYLIISPVLLPFTTSLSPPGASLTITAWRKSTDHQSDSESQFLAYPTLAVFGSTDVFTAARRLQSWAQKLATSATSKFEWEAIKDAGHFWREKGAMQALQGRISSWAAALG
jgi:pimeloyl-ACP methyl ester carboxylesterase